MVTLLFDMNKDSFKPKIVSSEYPDLTLLIDTGADIPVWCLGVPAFKDTFPLAVELKYKFVLSGFGTGIEIAQAFSIPEFKLSDRNNDITYQNMAVAVTNRPSVNVSFILSASLFHHMEMNIDRLSSVMYPTLSLKSSNPNVPVFYRIRELTEKQKTILDLSEEAIIADIYADANRMDGDTSEM